MKRIDGFGELRDVPPPPCGARFGLNNWFPSPIWEILDPPLITLYSKGTQIVYIEPPSHSELFCCEDVCLDEDYNELILNHFYYLLL